MWIACKDKMPPEGKEVLGWWYNEEIHVGGLYQGEWRRQMDEEEWAMPVYWCELPPPPQTQEK